MKTKTIATSKVEMLVVDLPEGKKFSEIKICCETYYTATETTQYSNSITTECISKSSKEWNYLGKATELTEEDWKGIVDYFTTNRFFPNIDVFKSYTNGELLHTATESGLSLLKANGIVLENELGKRPDATTFDTTGAYIHMVDVWQQVESKVWRNCHVFIKQN